LLSSLGCFIIGDKHKEERSSNMGEVRVHLKTKWLDEEAYIVSGYYGDESIAWKAYSLEGEPLCTPTVCLVEYNQEPRPEHVFIKNWSENEGILESLIAGGIISEPVRTLPAGFCKAYECRILKPELL
jgi:hypothetical protein